MYLWSSVELFVRWVSLGCAEMVLGHNGKTAFCNEGSMRVSEFLSSLREVAPAL